MNRVKIEASTVLGVAERTQKNKQKDHGELENQNDVKHPD